MVRYFEDLEVGATIDCGSISVTREEIVEFGERYDPQPFHTDEVAATDSVFGGVVASGWHTCGLAQRRIVEATSDMAFLAARGIDDLRWHTPLRPGDTLSVVSEIVGKRPSGSDPSRGHVDVASVAENQDGERVVSMTALTVMARDPERRN